MSLEDLDLEFSEEVTFESPHGILLMHSMCVYNDFLYIYAPASTSGYNSSNPKHFFRVSLLDGHVESLTFPTISTLTSRLAMIPYNNKIFFIGSYTRSSSSSASYPHQAACYDTRNDTWANLNKVATALNARGCLSLSSCFARDNYLYILGSYTGSYNGKFCRFNMDDYSVEELPVSTNTYSSTALCDLSDPNKLLASTTISSSSSRNAFAYYDFTANTWTSLERYDLVTGFAETVYNSSTSYLLPLINYKNKIIAHNVPSDSLANAMEYSTRLTVIDHDDKKIYRNLIQIPKEITGYFGTSGTSWSASDIAQMLWSANKNQSERFWGNKYLFMYPCGDKNDPNYKIISMALEQCTTGDISYIEDKGTKKLEKYINRIEVNSENPPKTYMRIYIKKNDKYLSYINGSWVECLKEDIIKKGMTKETLESLNVIEFKKEFAINDEISFTIGMMTKDPLQTPVLRAIFVS